MNRSILFLLVVGLTLAGCIGTPGAEPGASYETTTNAGGTMTVAETKEDKAALCTDGVNLDSDERFCAERRIELKGEIDGVAKMDVALSTFNGAVKLTADGGNDWRVIATLHARGATEADARARLDQIKWTFEHQDGESHFLEARAEKEGDASNLGASLEVTVPSSIVYVVVAATSNGAVEAKGLKTDGLSLATSNGAVVVDAESTQVNIGTSNGAIDAKLRPSASGRTTLATSNGAITLRVPEDAERGYDLDATTSNGEVAIALKDGKASECPTNEYYTPPCNHREFTTNGYSSRDVQQLVTLGSSNGQIEVSSA